MATRRPASPEEEALGALPPFSALEDDDRRRLAPYVRLRDHADKEVLFREGDPSDRFCTVVQGQVKVVKSTPQGKERILEILGPGDPFGAVAAYQGRPYPASALALGPVRVLSLARSDFLALIERHPAIARGLLLGLTRRLMELTRTLSQSSRGVEERIAAFFLKMADRLGEQRGDGIAIPLALSRQDIADVAGATLETAIRVMSRWGREGILTGEKGSFLLRDRELLERIARVREP
ncbi:MAG TPA: Crp/Fnr family transcriptional regulator [Candidatus Polarisedimenticolia bacterium]|nr:Crp/Fnr family transcriptional regulator [Candidatus Polarisedimenticolia bacterium]